MRRIRSSLVLAAAAIGWSAAFVTPPASAAPTAVDIGIRAADPGQFAHATGNSVTGVTLEMLVDNAKPNNVQVQITAQLPRGWFGHCGARDERFRACHSGRTVSWIMWRGGSTSGGQPALLGIYPSPDTPEGSVTKIRIHADPVGARDTDSSNNDLFAYITMHGIADLSASMEQSTTTAAVGDAVRFRVTIRNNGPDAAVRPAVHLIGRGMGTGRFEFSMPARAGSCYPRRLDGDDLHLECDLLADIDPHSTLIMSVAWMVGRDATGGRLEVLYGSFSTDPTGPRLRLFAGPAVQDVAVSRLNSTPVAVAPAAQPASPAPTAPPLADTGSAAAAELEIATVLILAGACCLWLGARRRPRVPPGLS